MTDQPDTPKPAPTPWLAVVPGSSPSTEESSPEGATEAATEEAPEDTGELGRKGAGPVEESSSRSAPAQDQPSHEESEAVDTDVEEVEPGDLEIVESGSARAAPPPLPPPPPVPVAPPPAAPAARSGPQALEDPLAAAKPVVAGEPSQTEEPGEPVEAVQSEGAVEPARPEALSEPRERLDDADGAPSEPSPSSPARVGPPPENEVTAAPAEAAQEPRRSLLDLAVEAAREVDPRSRLDALAGEMEAEEDRLFKAVLCYEVGEVQEGRLGDEPAAIKSYSKALGLDPQFLPNLWAVRRVFWRRKLWPNLLKLIDAELKLVTVPAHRASLLMEKGDVLRRHHGDPDGGLACYEQAHRADPMQLAPILALEKLYRERGQLDALGAIMEDHLAATGQPERKAAILLSQSQLEAQIPQGRYERRWELLEAALALTTRPERILGEMEHLARGEDHLEHQLQVLEHRKNALLRDLAADSTSVQVEDGSAGPAASQWEATTGVAKDPQVGPLDEAPTGVAKDPQVGPQDEAPTGVAKDPQVGPLDEAPTGVAKDPQVGPLDAAPTGVAKDPQVGPLDEAPTGVAKDPQVGPLDEAPTGVRVDASTAPSKEPSDEPQAAPAPGAGEGAAERLAAAYAQTRLGARLLERAGAPARAWDLLVPWRDRLGTHPVFQGDLLGLAARLGRWDELAKLLGEQQEVAPPSARQGLRLEQAMALHRAGRSDEAILLVRDGLDSSAPHPVVLALRELTALGSGDIEGLIELLGRTLDGLESLAQDDPADAVDAWRAELWTQRALLGLEAGEAISTVKEACRAARVSVPGYPPATDLLETLLLQEGAWNDLVALYKLELVGASDERAAMLLEALAEIQTVWIPSPDGRLDALLQLTVRFPSSLAYRLRLLDALAETGRPEDVLEQIEPLLAMTSESAELSAELALLGARLAADRLNDLDRAESLLGRGLDLCPGHPELSAQLEMTLRDGGRHEALAALYRAEAARTFEDSAVRFNLLSLAWVLERDLDRPTEAVEVYEQLLQRSPEDAGALALLGRALAAAGEHGRLAEVRALQADVLPEPSDQATLYQLVGELREDQNDDDLRAEEAYLRALALSPSAAEPLYSLASLAGRRRDWFKTAEVLDELLRSPGPEEGRRSLLGELAWLLEGPRADPSGASVHWLELATLDPPVPTAFWAAVRLAVTRREWGEAASALDWLAGMAEKAREPELMASLTCRAAIYGAVAGLAPGPRLVKAAGAEVGGELARVFATDLSPLQGQGAAERLKRRLQEVTPEDQRAGFDLLQALLLDREGRVREAAELLRAGLGGTRSDLPRLVVLRHLATKAGDGLLVADCCGRIAALLSDDEQAAALLREGAAVAGDPATASRLLVQALERAPRDGEALETLVTHLVTLGRADEAARCIGYRLSQGVPDEEEVSLRWRRADLRIHSLGDPEGAAVDLYQVLQRNPDHGPALMRLAQLQAEDGAYDEAAALLGQRLDLARPEDAEELRLARLMLAEVLERGGRSLEEVLEPLETLLLERPGDADLLERKHAVLLRARDFSAAVAVLNERYHGLADRKERAEGELRKAAVFRDLAANSEEARRALEAARDLDPLSREAVLRLSALYADLEDRGSRKMVLSSALDSHREALRRLASLEADPIRFLVQLFQESDDGDGQFFALGALEVLGALVPEESQRLEKLRGALVEVKPGRLTAELWSKYLFHPFALGGLMDLWELIGPATYQVWPEDLATYGVGKAERAAAKTAAGVAKEIFDLAGSLGIQVEELYVGGNAPTEIRGVGTASGAALVVGARVGPRLGPGERHRLGTVLAAMRLGALALPRIPARDLELLVVSAIREGQPEYRRDLISDRMEELGKRMHKALSRKERKSLPLAAASAVGAGIDLGRWRLGVERTLARVGLLCSGDLKASVEAERGIPGASRVAEDDDAQRGVVLFALSEAHLELRRSLGVAR